MLKTRNPKSNMSPIVDTNIPDNVPSRVAVNVNPNIVTNRNDRHPFLTKLHQIHVRWLFKYGYCGFLTNYLMRHFAYFC